MTEKIKFSVTKNGKPLDPSLYTWDEKTRTFSSTENGLVLDFAGVLGCTFKTGYDCTFNTESGCVIIRRDEFEVIQPLENEVIKLWPYGVKGYISKRDNEDAFYKDIDGERVEHIIADGILSKVVKKRGNVYHVINHGEDEVSFIVTDGENYSHGATLEEAKNDLKYKLSSRDTSAYKDLTLKSELTLEEAIKMYRTITGACERGTKIFVEQVLKTPKEKYTVSEVIELTKGRWNHDLLVKFFEGKEG